MKKVVVGALAVAVAVLISASVSAQLRLSCTDVANCVTGIKTGPQGPQGPAGATGPQGPQGPQGESGAPEGVGFYWVTALIPLASEYACVRGYAPPKCVKGDPTVTSVIYLKRTGTIYELFEKGSNDNMCNSVSTLYSNLRFGGVVMSYNRGDEVLYAKLCATTSSFSSLPIDIRDCYR